MLRGDFDFDLDARTGAPVGEHVRSRLDVTEPIAQDGPAYREVIRVYWTAVDPYDFCN
jgi:hypothetical protein